jgi:hypothetical protein
MWKLLGAIFLILMCGGLSLGIAESLGIQDNPHTDSDLYDLFGYLGLGIGLLVTVWLYQRMKEREKKVEQEREKERARSATPTRTSSTHIDLDRDDDLREWEGIEDLVKDSGPSLLDRLIDAGTSAARWVEDEWDKNL